MAKAITYETVQDLATTVDLRFDKGLNGYKPVYKEVSPTIKSNGASTIYPFAELPTMREWVGDRVVNNIKEQKYILVNRIFESTLEIPRTALEDDDTGFYQGQAEGLGQDAAKYPDELLGEAITNGFSTGVAYDNKPFFGEHGSGNNLFNNLQTGTGEPWILVDNSKAITPFFWQERVAFKMEKPADLSDRTFMQDQYLFGVRGRGAIGYGLPQLAYGSQAVLNEKNFELALKNMLFVKKENGKSVGANPTHILVGPENYSKALKIFNNAFSKGGGSNTYFGKVKVMLLPYISTPATPTSPTEEGTQG